MDPPARCGACDAAIDACECDAGALRRWQAALEGLRGDRRQLAEIVGRTRRRRKRSAAPGRTKVRLAEMLTEQLGVEMRPEDLWVQNPQYSRAWWDCCRWGGTGRVLSDNGIVIEKNVHSWERMGSIVKARKVVWVHEDDGQVASG